jgi:hypothetical protein
MPRKAMSLILFRSTTMVSFEVAPRDAAAFQAFLKTEVPRKYAREVLRCSIASLEGPYCKTNTVDTAAQVLENRHSATPLAMKGYIKTLQCLEDTPTTLLDKDELQKMRVQLLVLLKFEQLQESQQEAQTVPLYAVPTAASHEENHEVLRLVAAALENPHCDATALLVAIDSITKLGAGDGHMLSLHQHRETVKRYAEITKGAPIDAELLKYRDYMLALLPAMLNVWKP